MHYKGTVKNGAVTLPRDAELPDGTEVEVTPVPHKPEARSYSPKKTFAERYKKFIGVCEGPSDFAENHDRYIHGAPKNK